MERDLSIIETRWEDLTVSREIDGTINEAYCRWCYAGGQFTYQDMDTLIDFCAEHMANEHWSPQQVRAYMKELLPGLEHWKRSTGK